MLMWLRHWQHLLMNIFIKLVVDIKNKKDWVGGDSQIKSGSQRLHESLNDIEKRIKEYKIATEKCEFEPINEQLGKIKIINTVEKIKIDYHYSKDSSSDGSYDEHDLQNSVITPNDNENTRDFYSSISKRISLMPVILFKSLLERNKRIKRSIPELLDKNGMTMAANLVEKEREKAYFECIDLRERVLLQEEQLLLEKRESEFQLNVIREEFCVNLEAEKQARTEAEARVKEQMSEIECLKAQLAQVGLKE